MKPGLSFGGYSAVYSSLVGKSGVIQSSSLLSTESVSVPAGDFTGCLKILRHRSSERLGGKYERINWFCEGVGLVKQVTLNTTLNLYSGQLRQVRTVLKLQSIQP